MFKSKLIIITSVLLLIFSLLNAQVDKPEESVVDITLEQNGKQGTVSATYKIPDGFHQTLQKDYFFLEVEDMPGITFSETIYPEGEKDADGYIEYKGKITLTKKFTIAGQIKTAEFKAVAGYQFCEDGGSCMFPEEREFVLALVVQDTQADKSSQPQSGTETKPAAQSKASFSEIKEKLDDFAIVNTAAGFIKSKKFISFIKEAKSSTGGLSANKFLGMNVWYILLLIVVGGIALNLTPCVLPMMPVTIAVIGAGTQAESKGKGFLIGGLYGLGMMLAYGTLGLIVVLTGSRFGAINSSPWFNLIIAIIFIFLALAMFDVLPIDFSRFQSKSISGKKSGKGKYITIFIMGVIAALLAGACVAPVLISVILYSVTLYSAGNIAGLLLPFLLGLGMALPWPFVGAGISVLPKPGNWMKWIKIIFGVIILIIALYYGYTAMHIFSDKPDEVVKHEKVLEEDESVKLDWNHSLIEGLDNAKKENKPVLIDFWASWCKNCLAMDASTFKDESVKASLSNFVLIKYQAENLKASPTKEILNHFNVLGLPTYAVLTPK